MNKTPDKSCKNLVKIYTYILYLKETVKCKICYEIYNILKLSCKNTFESQLNYKPQV